MISEINTLMYYVLYDHGRNSVLYEQYEKHKNIFLSGCLQMSQNQNNVRTKELMMSGCLKAWALNSSSSLLSCAACCCCCGRIESAACCYYWLLLLNVLRAELATATNNYDIYGHPHDHWDWALAWPMAIRIHWLNWGLANTYHYTCLVKTESRLAWRTSREGSVS